MKQTWNVLAFAILVSQCGYAEARWLSVDPVKAQPNNPITFNRYHYAANNPYKFKDPDGREIRFAPGAPASFYRSAAAAIRYLNSNGQANGIGQVQMHRDAVTIKPAADRADIYQNRFDANTKTLYWADQSALQLTDPVTGESGVRSPALIFGHEVEHAANFLADPSGYAKDINTPDAQFDNREEANVITEYENPAAEQLGEPTRGQHTGSSEPVRASCVKSECP